MAIVDIPKCSYCGEYHFNWCTKEMMKRFDSQYRCVICGLPIHQHNPMMGMGSGSDEYLKQQFAHEACYWRQRANEAEAEVKRLSALIANFEHPDY